MEDFGDMSKLTVAQECVDVIKQFCRYATWHTIFCDFITCHLFLKSYGACVSETVAVLLSV